MIKEYLRLIIAEMELLREHYKKNGQTEAAMGVLASIAVVEDWLNEPFE